MENSQSPVGILNYSLGSRDGAWIQMALTDVYLRAGVAVENFHCFQATVESVFGNVHKYLLHTIQPCCTMQPG